MSRRARVALYIVISVLFTTVMASCNRGSSDDDVSVENDNSDESGDDLLSGTKITFTASISNQSVTNVSSKAGYSNATLPSNFEINVTSNNSSYSYSDVDMSYNSSSASWVSEQAMYWADSTTPVEVEAFVPYRFTDSEYTIQSDQSSAALLSACDLLYYYNGAVSPTSEAVPITFEHIMSKLYIKINLTNTGVSTDLSINPITSPVITGIVTTADISDPESIQSVPTAISTSITPYTSSTEATDMGDSFYSTPTSNSAVAYYEMIVVPQSIAAGDLSMSLTTDNNKANWSSPSSYTFESGQTYVITLSLSVSLDGTTNQDDTTSQLQLVSFVGNDWYSGENIVVEATMVE